jgi:hypothetical protein
VIPDQRPTISIAKRTNDVDDVHHDDGRHKFNIFLSYAQEDVTVAKRVAEALAQEGWSVWWDRTILAGTTWREEIEAALDKSHCVIVLWSTHSVGSHWVIEEAETGRARGALCPVLIETVKQPLGFRSIQAADLSTWEGDKSAASFKSLREALVQLRGRRRQA